MLNKLLDFIKKNLEIILIIFLWLCVWTTYNTDIFRFFNPGFPNNAFDLIHAIRSLFPFIALVIALVILVKNNKFNLDLFRGPLGLFLIYSFIGVGASAFSINPWQAMYWGIIYLSVIFILFSIISLPSGEKNIIYLIIINFIIAAIITILLMVFFFLEPGSFSIDTMVRFFSGFRPFEGIGSISAGDKILGMVGSRPTGLGRYASIVAIICFSMLGLSKNKKNILYFLVFLFFTIILIFSRARTSIVAFLFVLFFISFIKIKNRISFIFILISFLLILVPTNFYNYVKAYLMPEGHVSINIQVQRMERDQADRLKKMWADRIEINDSNILKKAGQNIGFPDNNISNLSGRIFIWHHAWNLFLTSPIIGRGFQADRIFLEGVHVHNAWMQALIQSGITGFLFFISGFLIFLIALLDRLKNKEKNKVLICCFGLTVFFIIRSITESFAYFSADWIFLAPLLAYIQFSKNGKLNNLKAKKTSVVILEKKIEIMSMSEVVEKIDNWIDEKSYKAHWVVVCGMHGIIEGYKDKNFMKIINSADVSLIDGMSLLFLGRIMGFNIRERIAGPDLMKEYFKFAEKKGQTVFLLGDTEDTLIRLVKATNSEFPKLKISGVYSPPFKNFNEEDNKKIISIINEKRPDIVWAAFSLKKQEEWIYCHRRELNVSVIVGVGAAFKFLSGKIKRAPKILRDIGFEWLWRLIVEPRTIWRRVFLGGPVFIFLIIRYFVFFTYQETIIKRIRPIIKRLLFFIENKFLWPMGQIFGKKLLNQLIPYDVRGFEEKIRLGNLSDGGYVIPAKVLSLIDAAYCYGVADHIDFEDDLLKHINIPVRLYDHTVEKLPTENKNFFFKKQGIAEKKFKNFDTFKNHLIENNDERKNIILKVDIEGFEWRIMADIINKFSENIVVIVVEFHQLYRYEKIIKYIKTLEKINSKFTLVHIHGNNNSGISKFGSEDIPNVCELTFINNKFVGAKEIMSSNLPSPLDYPNIIGKKDVILNFWRDKKI